MSFRIAVGVALACVSAQVITQCQRLTPVGRILRNEMKVEGERVSPAQMAATRYSSFTKVSPPRQRRDTSYQLEVISTT